MDRKESPIDWQPSPVKRQQGEGQSIRLFLSATYSESFFDKTTTSAGLVYQRYSPFRFSYTHSGDLNDDGINLNDLVFIPGSVDQITLVKDGTAEPRTPAEI